MLTCPVCRTVFDPADRAAPGSNDSNLEQMIYCSERCQRKARNRRNYERHKQDRIAAVLAKRKTQKK